MTKFKRDRPSKQSKVKNVLITVAVVMVTVLLFGAIFALADNGKSGKPGTSGKPDTSGKPGTTDEPDNGSDDGEKPGENDNDIKEYEGIIILPPAPV